MRFSQLRNSRLPKSCVIIGLDPMISVLGNSKIPYRDPRVKLGDDRKRDPPPKGLGDDTEHVRRAFYRDCFASLAMTEF